MVDACKTKTASHPNVSDEILLTFSVAQILN